MQAPSYTPPQIDPNAQDRGETLLLALLAVLFITALPATILAQLLLWALR